MTDAADSPLNRRDEAIWTAEGPHRFFGLQLGARMTVVRLDDGTLWIHSPIEYDETLHEAVSELGPVRHIVGPNRFHHVYLGPWAEAFPDALLWGAPGLAEKRTDLEFDRVLTRDEAPWTDEIEPRAIAGADMLGEVVFYHRQSRTIVSADLFLNEHTPPNFLTKAYFWLSGVLGEPGLSPAVLLAFDDKRAAGAFYRSLLDWDFERIIVAHGEVVEEDARETLEHVIERHF